MKNRRLPAPDGLDFFPTPPWATRALMLMLFDFLPRISLGRNQWRMETAWDPCCGAGHMSGVLRETFSTVHESDVHPYGQDTVLDFLDTEFCADPDLDAIVMNPPFTILPKTGTTPMCSTYGTTTVADFHLRWNMLDSWRAFR